MGKHNASPERFDQMREMAYGTDRSFLLPDTCRIHPPERIIDSAGSYSEQLGNPLEYNFSVHIPCRLDVTRYYRQAEVFGQEAIISDFELHVPHDMELHHDYTIEIDGLYYEIRKLMDAEDWRVTNMALVSRIGQGTLT